MSNAFFERLGPVALLYDADALTADAASRDVVDQLDAVETAVESLGGTAERLGVGLDLAHFKARLTALAPGLAFNLVESLDGSDRLQTVAPLLLEDWRVPYTGCGSAAMLLANHKIECKRRLAECGLPVPDCVWADGRGVVRAVPGKMAEDVSGDWIVKAAESHASLFLDDASVLRNASRAAAAARMAEATRAHGQPFFAERFIDGREFNLSLLEKASGGVEVLPVAEISFASLPADRPRLVGYAAKWDENSVEYQATPRTFDHGDADLAMELVRIALAVWDVLGLSGYARVDFRVDADGRPFILEANANPCLTPDAGFAAAARQAGLDYGQMIERIAVAGLARGGKAV